MITFQIALQVCMGLQIISGSHMWDDLEKGNQKMWDDIANRNQKMRDDIANRSQKMRDEIEKGNQKIRDDIEKGNQKIRDDIEKGIQKKWNDIEKGNDRHHKDLSQNEKGQSGAPPPVTNLTSEVGTSCSCGKVLLSSLGPAANYQPQAMGTYTM